MLTRIVAMMGHNLLMFSRVTWQFRALNALNESTRRTASLSSFSKAVRTACTAASMPEICPPQSWEHPMASCMSGFAIERTALVMMHLAVSPIPIGRTPGLLSNAIKRHARVGAIISGSKKGVQILLVVIASELHISSESPWKEVHIHLHQCASIP